MAKRTTRSQADDAAAQEAPGKGKGRVKARREMGPQAIANREPDTVKPNSITAGPETISEQLDDPSRVQQAPGDVFAATGLLSGRQPTDEQIRERAYQMYLERGGSDGMDFDDWLRAELELRAGRQNG
jgi:hypothetical protein